MMLDSHAPVLVVGAGIMGAGIAQVAAQAGHPVRLFDARDGAAAEARGKLAATLDGLVARGRLEAAAAAATLDCRSWGGMGAECDRAVPQDGLCRAGLARASDKI